MKSEPLVSVLTPTYNHEAFIGQCIESVLAQTFNSWEMILIDDGSTDATWEIVCDYAAADPRIRGYRQHNKGIYRLAETYNKALQQSRGSLIAILEGDDLWPADKLDIQVSVHSRHPKVILSHGLCKIVDRGAAKITGSKCEPPAEGRVPASQYLSYLLTRRSCIMPVTVLIDRDALVDAGAFHQKADVPTVDHLTWAHLFRISGDVLWIDKTLGYWRAHHEQTTERKSLELSKGLMDFDIEFFSNLDTVTKHQLGITIEDVIKGNQRNVLHPSYLVAMRQALVRKQSEEAVKWARRLLDEGSLKRRIQGAVGLLACNVGGDLEFIFAAVDRWKEWMAGFLNWMGKARPPRFDH